MHNISQASLKDVVLSDMSTSDSASTRDLMTLATTSVVQSGIGQNNTSSTYPIPYVKTRGWTFDDRSSTSVLPLSPGSRPTLYPDPRHTTAPYLLFLHSILPSGIPRFIRQPCMLTSLLSCVSSSTGNSRLLLSSHGFRPSAYSLYLSTYPTRTSFPSSPSYHNLERPYD